MEDTQKRKMYMPQFRPQLFYGWSAALILGPVLAQCVVYAVLCFGFGMCLTSAIPWIMVALIIFPAVFLLRWMLRGIMREEMNDMLKTIEDGGAVRSIHRAKIKAFYLFPGKVFWVSMSLMVVLLLPVSLFSLRFIGGSAFFNLLFVPMACYMMLSVIYSVEANKAMELKMSELMGRIEAGQQPHKAPSKMDLKRQLWSNASEESLNDYASDFILEGVENAVGVVMQGTQAELAKRDELIARLSSQLEETAARANSGVDAAVEQRILQKHPGLAALPVAQRMAMVKDLAGVTPANAGPGKLLNRISTAGNPADHVEGSALSTPHSSDEALMEEFDKVDNSKKELSILGKLVAQNGSFAGYNPTGY